MALATKSSTNPLIKRAQKAAQNIPDWARGELNEIPPLSKGAAHALPGQQPSLHEGAEADTDAVLIPRDSIEASTLNARRHFDPDVLRELGQSMKEHGQLQPIVVRPHPTKDGIYQIVSGERRWRAADPKYGDVPILRARVGNYNDTAVRTLSLIENINREDLSPLEIAQQLIELKNVSARIHWDDVARMVGHKRQWVDRFVALIEAPATVQRAVEEGKLTPSHARAIRQLEPPQQVRLAHAAIREQLTTRQLEDKVKELKAPAASSISTRTVKADESKQPTPYQRGEQIAGHLFQAKLDIDAAIGASHGDVSAEWDERILREMETIELRLGALRKALPELGKLRKVG